jgi:hypothetical protein
VAASGTTEHELVYDLAAFSMTKRRVAIEMQKVFRQQRVGRPLDQGVGQSLVAKMSDGGLTMEESPEATRVLLAGLDKKIERARKSDPGYLTRLKKARQGTEMCLPEVADQKNLHDRADAVERILRLDAIVDARVDKVLKRLIATKEYKKIIGLKLIEGSAG